MTNKKTLDFVGICALVIFSLTLASASNLAFQFPVVTGSPGQTVSGIFNFSNTTDLTGVTLSGSGISFSQSSFSNFPQNGISYTLTIPQFQSPGSFAPLFTATETLSNSTVIAENFSVSNLNVNSVNSFTMPSSLSLDSTGKATLSITNNGNTLITVNLAQTGTDFTVNLSQNPVQVAAGSTANVIVQSTANPSTLTFGSRSITVTGTATGATSQTTTISLTGGSFCTSGKAGGNLTISTVDVTSSGSDDTIWMPLDEVKVKVEVDNNGNSDLSGINLEIGLFDSNGINRAGNLNFLSDGDKKMDLGTISSGNSKTRTFDFTIPADLKIDSYTLLAKAYTRSNQAANCYDTVNTGLSQSVSVEQEDTVSKYLAFNNVQVTPDSATCGNAVTITLDAINIGSEDQSRIRVNVVNQALGIDQSQEIVNGLSTGETSSLSFSFSVPQNLANGNYPVQISADYQYSNGAYHQTGSGIIQNMPFQVIGCTQTSTTVGEPQINATLVSSSEVGQNLAVQVTVTNPGNITDFIITPTGYESWANLVSVQPQILNVPSSQSRTAVITFTPTKSGTQTFTIQAVYNGKTTSQQVSVNVAGASSPFAGLGIGTTALYIIAAVLLILIIVLIILIVRASGSRKSEF